jgi:hypothetical protein
MQGHGQRLGKSPEPTNSLMLTRRANILSKELVASLPPLFHASKVHVHLACLGEVECSVGRHILGKRKRERERERECVCVYVSERAAIVSYQRARRVACGACVPAAVRSCWCPVSSDVMTSQASKLCM